MSKIAIVGNGIDKESILKQLSDIDSKGIEVISNADKLKEILEKNSELSSIVDYIQEIKSNKQESLDKTIQNCEKNFKRKRIFS